jgi:hypothetical protein
LDEAPKGEGQKVRLKSRFFICEEYNLLTDTMITIGLRIYDAGP